VISATIVFLLALTGPLFSQQKYDQLELTHRHSAAKFAILEQNVRRCMALPAQNRIPPGPYTSYIDSVLKINTETAPPLSTASIARYNRSVSAKKDTTGMALPLDPTRVKVHVEEATPLNWQGSSCAIPITDLLAHHVDPEMQFELERHAHWNRAKENQPRQ
jgi:ABC-type phosphate transport system permease subunit